MHKRIPRLEENTLDSILSLLPETQGHLTYSSVSLFQPRRRKTLTLHEGELPPSIPLCPSLGKQTDQMRPLCNLAKQLSLTGGSKANKQNIYLKSSFDYKTTESISLEETKMKTTHNFVSGVKPVDSCKSNHSPRVVCGQFIF